MYIAIVISQTLKRGVKTHLLAISPPFFQTMPKKNVSPLEVLPSLHIKTINIVMMIITITTIMMTIQVSPAVLDFKLDEEEDYMFLKQILHSK